MTDEFLPESQYAGGLTNIVGTVDRAVTQNMTRVELVVGDYETGINIQLWNHGSSDFCRIIQKPFQQRSSVMCTVSISEA